MSRYFQIKVTEIGYLPNDVSPAPPGVYSVSEECATLVMHAIADDIGLFSFDDGKLVHPDD